MLQNRQHRIFQSFPKRRFSELAGEAACYQEYAGGLKQGLHDEAEPGIAQGEAFVLEDPGIAALDRPGLLSQPDPRGWPRLWMAGVAPKARHSSRWRSASYPLSANTFRIRAVTAKAARNSRSKTSVSLTFAAVAIQASGT